jgi:uncharacterized protein YggE
VVSVADFIDVEDFLNGRLGSSTSVPTTLPFTRVIRTGGPGRRTRVSDQATVSVESWASTETDAERLANDNRRIINDLQGTVVAGVNVKSVEENSSPGNLPHPTISGYRYVQSFDIHIRGELE